MRTITVVWIGDGYLAAAAPADAVWGPGYWANNLADEDGFETATVEVRDELAEQLCRQGSSDQHFSDGYDAANALAAEMKPHTGS